MENKKIFVTQQLISNIVTLRKERSLSSHELSEKTGHSKYWLSNIENGKTKKILKKDLISIYKILYQTDDDEEASLYVEKILNQQIGSDKKEWYELINISEDFSDEYDKMLLLAKLKELLSDKICDCLIQRVYNMSIHEAQAALTSITNLYYSIYKNPELALVLTNIPIYGVGEMNVTEYENALNDLLSISAKYNDLVIKNDSINVIKMWQKRDAEQIVLDKKNAKSALDNFNSMLKVILDSKNSNLSMYDVLHQFNTSVSFMIENVCHGTLGRDINYQVYSGKGFAKLLDECFEWFLDNEDTYDLPKVISYINGSDYESASNYLKSVGDFPPKIINS